MKRPAPIDSKTPLPWRLSGTQRSRTMPALAWYCLAVLVSGGMIIGNVACRGETKLSERTVNPNHDYSAKAILAGGCFWCTEAVFEEINGVGDVVSGYIGGQMENPNYKAVCTGRTGHAEAVEVYYDPNVIGYEDILKIFFKTHDPTTLNRQGADVGTQYRSAIFYQTQEEKERAQAFIEKLDKAHEFRDPIVTTLEPASKFYPAEEYHQDYYRLNPYAGYCRAVVRQKVQKTKNVFRDQLKSSQPKESGKQEANP